MTKTKAKKIILQVGLLFAILMALSTSLLELFPTSLTPHADKNPAAWVMCKTDDGKMLYNSATTDLLPFSIQSKSSTATTDRLDGFLNQILTTSGFNFNKANTAILGHPVDNHGGDTKDPKPSGVKATNPNKTAPRVNPFDRFGVAGLHWTSYNGEWKYYQTDGCADGNESAKTNFGVFYQGRKEPKASFNETASSTDPRVIQFNRGAPAAIISAFNNTVSNAIFSIAKIIVTLTIALVSLSFTDISNLIGFGVNSQTGGVVVMFTKLYNGLFIPLVVLAFLFTACYVLYWGLIKRQIRQAFISGLGQAFVCFFVAIVIAGKPVFWIPLPNQIATYGEAVIVAAIGQGANSGKTICNTSIGKVKEGSDYVDPTNAEITTLGKSMSKVGEDMRSTIGCRMWEEFLLKPWARGQFGTEYSNLTVGGTKDGKLANINSKWVHTADVPLGGGDVEHNLALFQLSTQTTAHAQLSGEAGTSTDPANNRPKLVDGISSDWWRVADTLSNYDEHSVSVTPPGGKDVVTTDEQIKNQPLAPWQSWVGNHQATRYGNAFVSALFGAIGAICPLVFGLLTAAYGVAVTLLMATAPLFLLLGCWAGKGQAICRGWLTALIATIIKKVVSAALLLISFAITVSLMNMANSIGWIKAFLLLAVLTVVMVRQRGAIIAALSQVNLGGSIRPDEMLAKFRDTKFAPKAKNVKNMMSGAAAGAYIAKRHGMTAGSGAITGASVIARRQMQGSTWGRNANIIIREYESANEEIECSICQAVIQSHETYYLDEENQPVCGSCVRDYGEDRILTKVARKRITPKQKRSGRDRLKQLKKEKLNEFKKSTPTNNDSNNSARTVFTRKDNDNWLSFSKTMERAQIKRTDKGLEWNNSEVKNLIHDNMRRLETTIDNYNSKDADVRLNSNCPELPEPLEDYASQADINVAWRNNDFDYIRKLYRESWARWYSDNSAGVVNVDDDVRNFTIEGIRNINYKK